MTTQEPTKLSRAIGVRRNPVHPSMTKVYVSTVGETFHTRNYSPTRSSRNRIARLVRSKQYFIYVRKNYYAILPKVQS